MTIIAIDGPSGSGKSTVARLIAERLQLPYLDTGAMYRAIAMVALNRAVDLLDDVMLEKIAAETKLQMLDERVEGRLLPRVVVSGIDSTQEIRTPEVSQAASAIAIHPGVRERLVRRQRNWVLERGGGVVEGRDIGSVVFPDADLKVFLTADDEERVRRRQADKDAPGFDELSTHEAARELSVRDERDSTRAVSPLAVVEGAFVVDTSDQDIEEVVIAIMVELRVRMGGNLPYGKCPLTRLVGWIGYKIGRWVMWFLGNVLWGMRIEGAENIPARGPFLLCPVHRSYVDGPLTATFTPRRMKYLAKNTVFKIRPLGWLFRSMGAISVNRDVVDRQSLHACLAALEAGHPLVLFPEGTRKTGPLLEDVDEGAAYLALRTGVPVVPVGIGGSAKAMPMSSKRFHFATIRVIIGEPIRFELEEGKRPSRTAIREGTQTITAAIQKLFDRAEQLTV